MDPNEQQRPEKKPLQPIQPAESLAEESSEQSEKEISHLEQKQEKPTENKEQADKQKETQPQSEQKTETQNQTAQPTQTQSAQPYIEKPSGGMKITEADKTKVLEKRKKTAAKKRSMIWLVVGFFAFVLLFGGLAIFLLSQGTPESNPFLKLLGIQSINKEALMLTIANIGFGLIVGLSFIISIVNFFRAGFAKKDADTKRKSIVLASVFGFFFIILLFVWAFTYLYLVQFIKAKPTDQPAKNYVTTPEETTNLTAPITIDFDAAPLKVDPKTYTILSYNWDFGDGEKGNGVSIKHTYTSKGTGEYEAKLVIRLLNKRNNKTIETEFKKFITIDNEKVRALFVATPEKGDSPLNVKFDASDSVDPDGEIIDYAWDFNEDNDFTDKTGKNIEHTFEQIGEYKISLRVTDNNNETDVFKKTITVENPNKADAVIEIDGNPEKFGKNTTYTFDGSNSSSLEGPIQRYEWNFGDGSRPETSRIANHSFTKEGRFEITLKIEDDKGNKGTATQRITVGKQAGAPKAVIKTNPALQDGIASGTVPFEVTFDGSDSTDSDDNIVEYKWDFDGDGKVDKKGVRATHTYQEKGSYEVVLMIEDADKNQADETIIIKAFSAGLMAALFADPVDGRVPLIVKLDASASSYKEGRIVSYEWDFGDDSGKVIGEANIEHEYNKIGTFIATVTAITTDGKRASSNITLNVRPVPLQACYTTNNKQGAAPLIVSFEPRCSTGPISEYTWKFGYDAKQSRVRKPTHTFEQPGTYTVQLEVRDQNNVISSYSQTIVVTGQVIE